LNAVRLWEYRDYSPSVLSGGQKQRLAIAAALAMADKILVLDEPNSQLDPCGAIDVLSFIHELRSGSKLTVVMTTVSGEEAADFADKICVLNNGSLAAFGTPRQIFSDKNLQACEAIHLPQVSEFAACMSSRSQPLPYFPVNLAEAAESVTNWYNSN
jgi:energy-coupling factor transport system ATP-binding protein